MGVKGLLVFLSFSFTFLLYSQNDSIKSIEKNILLRNNVFYPEAKILSENTYSYDILWNKKQIKIYKEEISSFLTNYDSLLVDVKLFIGQVLKDVKFIAVKDDLFLFDQKGEIKEIRDKEVVQLLLTGTKQNNQELVSNSSIPLKTTKIQKTWLLPLSLVTLVLSYDYFQNANYIQENINSAKKLNLDTRKLESIKSRLTIFGGIFLAVALINASIAFESIEIFQNKEQVGFKYKF